MSIKQEKIDWQERAKYEEKKCQERKEKYFLFLRLGIIFPFILLIFYKPEIAKQIILTIFTYKNFVVIKILSALLLSVYVLDVFKKLFQLWSLLWGTLEGINAKREGRQLERKRGKTTVIPKPQLFKEIDIEMTKAERQEIFQYNEDVVKEIQENRKKRKNKNKLFNK